VMENGTESLRAFEMPRSVSKMGKRAIRQRTATDWLLLQKLLQGKYRSLREKQPDLPVASGLAVARPEERLTNDIKLKAPWSRAFSDPTPQCRVGHSDSLGRAGYVVVTLRSGVGFDDEWSRLHRHMKRPRAQKVNRAT